MSRRRLLLILAACLHLGLVEAASGQLPEDSIAPRMGPQLPYQFTSQSLKTTIGYYAFVPANYNPRQDEPLPVLIFLHGLGERGNGGSELPRLFKWGLPRLARQGRQFPMLVIAPQLPLNQKRWPVALLDELIAEVEATWRVDTTRLYLTGLSTGGDGVWAYALARPQVIAAIIPIAAAANADGICAMREVAVWAFHGELDRDEKLDHELLPVNALNACQPPPVEPARLTVYAGAGHEVWTRTYDGRAGNDIYAWLLTHHR
jgi:predicted peptidase